MRIIDGDELRKELIRGHDLIGAKYVDLAPTIEIIRCGECKWGKPYGDKQLECDALGLGGLKFPDDFCSYGKVSEKPNNCEHITEDGVTCAKYPACDDCIDNPLNKVKGVGKTDRFRKE